MKNLSIGRALSIINGPENLKKEREAKINEKITKKSLKEYLSHITKFDEEEKDNDTTELIEKINELLELSKKIK